MCTAIAMMERRMSTSTVINDKTIMGIGIGWPIQFARFVSAWRTDWLDQRRSC